MVDEQFLAMLRCPIDPKREARLVLDDVKVVCERCRVQYKTREGFLCLIAEEAVLPEGCERIDQLPCQAGSKR